MAFRDDMQMHTAISALLTGTAGPRRWNASGPLELRQAFDGEFQLDMASIAQGIAKQPIDSVVGIDAMLRMPEAWQRALFGLLHAHAEGPSAIDRWLLAYALPITGARLRAMRIADPARWTALLRDGIAIATSKPQLATVYGVDLKTVYDWLDEAKLRDEANKRFSGLRTKKTVPVAPRRKRKAAA